MWLLPYIFLLLRYFLSFCYLLSLAVLEVKVDEKRRHASNKGHNHLDNDRIYLHVWMEEVFADIVLNHNLLILKGQA